MVLFTQEMFSMCLLIWVEKRKKKWNGDRLDFNTNSLSAVPYSATLNIARNNVYFSISAAVKSVVTMFFFPQSLKIKATPQSAESLKLSHQSIHNRDAYPSRVDPLTANSIEAKRKRKLLVFYLCLLRLLLPFYSPVLPFLRFFFFPIWFGFSFSLIIYQ